MKHLYLAFLFVFFFEGNTLFATSVIPFKHLGEAAKVSEAVVLATAEGNFETTVGGVTFFDCRFRVHRNVKGPLTLNESFALRQFSHRLGDFTGDIAGDFVPEEGKTYLLFLHRVGDVWRPVTLSYYVFEEKQLAGENLLVPVEEGLGIVLVPRPDGVLPEPAGVYRTEKLLPILQNYANQDAQTWNASSALTGFSPNDFPQERALPTGCDFALGVDLSRWQDAAIQVYFDDTGAPGGFAGILDNIMGAMNSSYVDIDPTNEGEVSFSPNCSDNTVTGPDLTTFLTSLNGNQTTLIFLDDPCSQIANLSGCSGTLAVGGSYSSSLSHSYKGDTWKNALWGYVVVNNGSFECLAIGDYEIMLTHELTHTYRMDHLNASLYPNQNMNPACCNPIGTKDAECMNYVYDIVSPVTLTAFEVQPHENQQVRVSWQTSAEKDNSHFTVERSADGLHFEFMKKIEGNNTRTMNQYAWIDPLPLPGLSYYRLTQTDFDGTLNNLGVKAVRMELRSDIRVFPNPAGNENLTVLLDLEHVFNGNLEIMDANGQILDSRILELESGRNKLEQPVGNLVPGVYWLRFQTDDAVQTVKFFKN